MATPVENRKYTKPTKKEPIPRLYADQRETDETPMAYYERCLAAIRESPEKYFQRRTIVRLQDERKEAAADVWATAGLIRDARRLKVWPRNPDSCLHWNRACEYFDVCTGIYEITDPLLFKVLDDPHPELDSSLADPDQKPSADGELVDEKVLLTQSALRCYRLCARKFYFRYELRARPVKEAEPLTVGRSLHKGLEKWFLTGDLEAAMAALDTTDPYRRAKESAMLVGHAERWGKPTGMIAVEKEFRSAMINPETGAASRTFVLGGRVDGLYDLEEGT
jgi:CRISPR/Cas system-associated exonuclease Cas4 (RecB family)